MAEASARRQEEPDLDLGSDENVTLLRERQAEAGRLEALKEAPKPGIEAPAPRVDTSGPGEAPRKPKRLRFVLLVLGPVLVAAAGLYLYLAGGRWVSTDNAYVRADMLSVATDVSGFVAEVAVRDNEEVARGQLLFRLDDEPYRIALAGARARLGAVRDELATLRATYRQNLAQIEQAKTDVDFYEAQFRRQQDLLQQRVAARTAFDQARRDLDSARERVQVAQSRAEATLAQLGGDADAEVTDNARFRQAQAQVAQAERDLRRTEVHAPTEGIVTNVDNLQVGAYLPAAQAAFDLVATDHVWVEANPKETDLTYVKPGDPAEVTVDTYPGRTWPATVASISPATGAEFSVLPAQNASGNWVKVVQRIPVRLRVEVPEGAPPLRAGMSVYVDVDTGHERSLASLVDAVEHRVGL